MFSFSLSILLYVYGLFLLLWIVFSVVAIYHMVKFGFRGVIAYLATIIFIAVSLAMLGVSWHYVSDINWDKQVTLFGGFSNQSDPFQY